MTVLSLSKTGIYLDALIFQLYLRVVFKKFIQYILQHGIIYQDFPFKMIFLIFCISMLLVRYYKRNLSEYIIFILIFIYGKNLRWVNTNYYFLIFHTIRTWWIIVETNESIFLYTYKIIWYRFIVVKRKSNIIISLNMQNLFKTCNF